jgi:hypothetical protein
MVVALSPHPAPNGTINLLDLSLATVDIARFFYVTALPDLSGSDHHPIFVEIQRHHMPILDFEPSSNFKRANWELYTQLVAE